jgi:hypothetical protein
MTLNEIESICNLCVTLSNDYYQERVKSAEAKVNFEILMTASMLEMRTERKGIGYDMACLRLMEDSETAKDFYKAWKESEAKYKGLERLLSANETKISFAQSKLKYQSQGERTGR